MSERTNDGGPAFPALERGETWENNDGAHVTSFESSAGMSLRDWFAGQALAGLCANRIEIAGLPKVAIVQDAYQIADAMLAVRNNQPTNL